MSLLYVGPTNFTKAFSYDYVNSYLGHLCILLSCPPPRAILFCAEIANSSPSVELLMLLSMELEYNTSGNI